MLLAPTGATIAMAVGYGATSLLSLTLNNHWVFKAHAQFKSVVVKYYVTYLSTWALSTLLAGVLSHLSMVNDHLIPIFSLIITVPTNFLLSKFWVFKNTSMKEAQRFGN
ncbi:GtrA family protein [Lentilactobacillus farraginis]|uniref:Conserved membrane protein, GtcA family n=1 Tax=Lentilactobacillus farraginis DSM 18382 = JCM 14108 TaxID=1423743 RepID=X0P9V4_9LACO|nr:GtcA family conserved membrane protein [Lentilactobacillus farraginis DSM 18382 = JCM 14108]GAF35808.1 conserved membrane protein, GtcA family [Lentilactobacillus farraginis DSM 18382 = JCM 14108]